jgi:hypothetical protein
MAKMALEMKDAGARKFRVILTGFHRGSSLKAKYVKKSTKYLLEKG